MPQPFMSRLRSCGDDGGMWVDPSTGSMNPFLQRNDAVRYRAERHVIDKGKIALEGTGTKVTYDTLAAEN